MRAFKSLKQSRALTGHFSFTNCNLGQKCLDNQRNRSPMATLRSSPHYPKTNKQSRVGEAAPEQTLFAVIPFTFLCELFSRFRHLNAHVILSLSEQLLINSWCATVPHWRQQWLLWILAGSSGVSVAANDALSNQPEELLLLRQLLLSNCTAIVVSMPTALGTMRVLWEDVPQCIRRSTCVRLMLAFKVPDNGNCGQKQSWVAPFSGTFLPDCLMRNSSLQLFQRC